MVIPLQCAVDNKMPSRFIRLQVPPNSLRVSFFFLSERERKERERGKEGEGEGEGEEGGGRRKRGEGEKKYRIRLLTQIQFFETSEKPWCKEKDQHTVTVYYIYSVRQVYSLVDPIHYQTLF
jgi:hypothetical protein